MKISSIKGIGSVLEKKLADIGIVDVAQLLSHPPAEIASKTTMDNDSAIALFRKAREHLEKEGKISKKLVKASELPDEEDVAKITTGTFCLDKLLSGGLYTHGVTEVYGEYGCGKTQFCNLITVRNQLPVSEGGLSTDEQRSKSIWIDSEETFSKNRIAKIAIANGLDPDEVLDNIIVAKAYNSSDQQMILEEVERVLLEDKSIKLIVIDSVMGLFRENFSGRGELSERQKYLSKFLALSASIAKNNGIATIWTNQVMINPGIFYGDPVNPVGGTVLAHKSTYRVYFKKSGKKRIGVMVDSPRSAQIEVMFALHERGIVDPEVLEEEEKEVKKLEAKTKREQKKIEDSEDE